MPTPPPLYRTKLPSGSPSSARLRKLAPSPVKVPPTPPLYTYTTPFFPTDPSPRAGPSSGPPFSAASSTCAGMPSSRSRGTGTEDSHDPFEYDFAPLERTALITSPMETGGVMYVQQRRYDLFDHTSQPHSYMHTHSVQSSNTIGATCATMNSSTAGSTPPLRVTRQDSMESNVSIPLLFDARGDFGVLAEKHRLALNNARRGQNYAVEAGEGEEGLSRGVLEVDAPEELDIEWFQSTGSGEGYSGLVFGRSSNTTTEIKLDTSPKSQAPPKVSRAKVEDVGEEEESTPFDRPARVLVNFNDNVFGVDSASTLTSVPMGDSPSSGSLLAPTIGPGQKYNGQSFASSSSSFSAPDPMSFTRDASLAESNYTFGNPCHVPTPISPTAQHLPGSRRERESIVAASIFEDDDGWSYTLSAYGDHEESDPHSRQSSEQSRPDGTTLPFLSPNGRSDSPSSAPSTTPSTLFTPNYTVVSPGIAGSSLYNDSPVPNRGIPSLFASPPSPRTAKNGRSEQEKNEGLGFGVGMRISESEKSDLTASPGRPAFERAAGRRKRGYTQGADTAVPLRLPGPREKLPTIESTHAQGLSGSKGKSDSLPEIIRQALNAIPKTTTVTLMIDQEGHREILTTMIHKSVLQPQDFRDKEIEALKSAALWCESPSRPEMFQQTGCVKFTAPNERKRPEWIFHHAAMEHLPVLRRVTVNQDEKHDYISRGATLQLRDVGVYAVYGYEDKGRAEWKFEYLVQAVISKSTGDIKPNEKKVIPLAFYASPSFFNPDRALKLNLLNVFKKQLTPNIVSEKVKTIRIGKPPPPPPSTTPVPPEPTPTTGAMARTLDAIAKAVGNRSTVGTPTTVESSGRQAPTEKKGRKRAATLFNRSRPITPATTQNTPIPPLIQLSVPLHGDKPQGVADSPSPSPLGIGFEGRSIKPMKSLSALALAKEREKLRPSTAEAVTYPGGKKGLVPIKSLSALRSSTTSGRPRTAEPIPSVPAVPMSMQRGPRGGSGDGPGGIMTIRSSHPFANELLAGRPATAIGVSHDQPVHQPPHRGLATLNARAPSRLATKDPNVTSIIVHDVRGKEDMWKMATKDWDIIDPFAKLPLPGDGMSKEYIEEGVRKSRGGRRRPLTAEPVDGVNRYR